MNEQIWDHIVMMMLASGKIWKTESSGGIERILFLEDGESYEWRYDSNADTIVLL